MTARNQTGSKTGNFCIHGTVARQSGKVKGEATEAMHALPAGAFIALKEHRADPWWSPMSPSATGVGGDTDAHLIAPSVSTRTPTQPHESGRRRPARCQRAGFPLSIAPLIQPTAANLSDTTAAANLTTHGPHFEQGWPSDGALRCGAHGRGLWPARPT